MEGRARAVSRLDLKSVPFGGGGSGSGMMGRKPTEDELMEITSVASSSNLTDRTCGGVSRQAQITARKADKKLQAEKEIESDWGFGEGGKTAELMLKRKMRMEKGKNRSKQKKRDQDPQYRFERLMRKRGEK